MKMGLEGVCPVWGSFAVPRLLWWEKIFFAGNNFRVFFFHYKNLRGLSQQHPVKHHPQCLGLRCL